MTLTAKEFVHRYDLPHELLVELESTGTSLEELAEVIEKNALGADLVTPSDEMPNPLGLLIEQYALMISDAELTANVTEALKKFRSWLFKFSPELVRF